MNLKQLTCLILIAGSLLFSSCKKDNDATPQQYLKFKINGNWVTWTKAEGELGPDLLDGGKTNFTLLANDDAMKTAFTISVQVNGTSLNTGTYSTDTHFMPISYMDISSSNLKEYSESGSMDGKPNPKYTLTLTSITDKSVTGKFSGNLLIDSFEDDFVEITEGEFTVPRVR